MKNRNNYFHTNLNRLREHIISAAGRKPKTPLVILMISVAFILRNVLNFQSSDLFGDQAWFLLSARDSVINSQLPILGITSSITWIHQGAVWTYFLIPVLVIGNFNPFSVFLATGVLNIFTPILVFRLVGKIFTKRSGIVCALVSATVPFFTYHSTLYYHTSLVLLFLVISLNLLIKKNYFLSAIYLGLAYQLHLLTFIYWPLYLLYFIIHKKIPTLFVLGFFIAIIPFILSGPIQTVGIFGWIIKNLFTGVSVSSGLSAAYKITLSLYVLIIIGFIVTKLPKKTITVYLPLILIFGIISPKFNVSSSFNEKIKIINKLIDRGATSESILKVVSPGGEFLTSSMPYEYLLWWKGYRAENSDTFLINEMTMEVSQQFSE